MRGVFADPKTDFVFKRIFGSAEHDAILIGFLNDLLGLDEQHRIIEVQLLPPEQVPPIDGLKLSIVDVKCTDVRGTRYIVEMQVLNVEGFEKRLVYNLCKAYTSQLVSGEDYPALNDVVAIAICDFQLWPDDRARHDIFVPMLSRWSMMEEQTKAPGPPHLRLVVLELPKYGAGDQPETPAEKWAYLFREAEYFREVPPSLATAPYAQALEVARTAHFTPEEWESYDRAKIAEQDARGALSLARSEGLLEGKKEGLLEGKKEGLLEGKKEGLLEGAQQALLMVLSGRDVELGGDDRQKILSCRDLEVLRGWLARAGSCTSARHLFRDA